MKPKRIAILIVGLAFLSLYYYKNEVAPQRAAKKEAVELAAKLPKELTVMAWNLENLFDTANDEGKHDGEFTPTGEKKWTPERLDDKLDKLAEVLQKASPEVPILIGLTEVEHEALADSLLVRAGFSYHRLAYKESPDFRGIDCALAYDARYFQLYQVEGYAVPGLEKSRYILEVKGTLASGDTLVCYVNHWPSRIGGRQKTEPKRMMASARLGELIAELPDGRMYLIMGDFNDTPRDASIMALKGRGDEELVHPFAAMEAGSYLFRDQFYMLDQIILSASLRDGEGLDLALGSAKVFSPEWLKQQVGKYQGYAHRTYAGSRYLGGYSDHWPVLLRLKTVEPVAL